MSNALKYFQENVNFHPTNRIEELDTLLHLEKSAELWLEEKKYFNAGYAYWQGIVSPWKIENEKLPVFYNNAINFLYISAAQNDSSSEIQILSLRFLRDIYSDLLSLGIKQKKFQQDISREFENVTCLLANRLIEKYNESKCSEFLLKGIYIEGTLDIKWNIALSIEESQRFKNRCSSYKVHSAFDLYLSIGDYTNAHEIIKFEPTKFDTNELRGWKNAVIGFIFPETRIESFNKVVLEFEKNSKDGWFIPTDIWIKYFKSRIEIESGFESLENIKESVISALNILKDTDKSFINYYVLRYKYILEVLYGLIELQDTEFIRNAENEYLKVLNHHIILNEDYKILTFFKEAIGFMDNAQNDYSEAFLKFRDIIETIDKLIFLPIKSGKKLQGYISDNLKTIIGGGTNWIIRTLEVIKPEPLLHKILLRLFQKLPSDVNVIVHGPLEHGRDIFHLERDTLILKSYQAKLGDIKLSDWRNNIKPQMEEMLEVSPPASLDKYKFNKRVGILIFTGHIKPNVEVVINSWKQKRLKEMKEEYDIMNIDDIKNFIVDNNLIAEFQRTLIDEQIEIVT